MASAKMFRLGLTALRDNFAPLGRPYKLTFSITYWCQSRCLTCNIWEIKPKNELTLQEIAEFAQKNNYFKWVEITGGEPFLRSDIVEIVRAFRDSCRDLYVLTMPTNSLCSYDIVMKRLEEILAMGIPKVSVTISLDGYRELHDKIRGVVGNFDKAMRIAKGLRELQKKYRNLFFVFGYTMSKFNEGELGKTVLEVMKEIPGVTYNDFHVNVGQISDIYYSNTGLDLRADRNIIEAEVRELIQKRNFEIGAIPMIEGVFLNKMVEYIKTGETPMRSKSLDASLFMDSYGNVYPSIMWGRKVGSIRETGYDLMPIWHGAEAEEVRKLIKEGKEPKAWTACEAYQAIVGNIGSFINL